MDIGKTRDRLAEVMRAVVPSGVEVHRSAFDGNAVFPAVIIGMPSWDDDTTVNYCAPRWTWPVAVVVNRPGIADEQTVAGLDELWPTVFHGLRDASHQDPTFGGVCVQSVIVRAQFGQFAIQGNQYPAQLITTELYG